MNIKYRIYWNNTLKKIWFQTITYYVCSTNMREHPHILYWIRICYGHVQDAATTSTRGLSGKNKYMNIRYLGLYISAHLFLCWIWPSPVNRSVFEGNCYSLRSFPALDATATRGRTAAPPPCHSTPAVVTPGGQQQWGEFLSSPLTMPTATAAVSKWRTLPTSLPVGNHATCTPVVGWWHIRSAATRRSVSYSLPLTFPESSSC